MDPYLLKQSLHKDFHYTLSLIFDFLNKNYGKEEADRIMKKVSRTIYLPLIEEMKEKGLPAMEKHMKELMELESGEYTSEKDDNSITFSINKCPAISHMKNKGLGISPDFCRISTGLAFGEIAKNTGYRFSLDYDREKGQCVQKYWKE